MLAGVTVGYVLGRVVVVVVLLVIGLLIVGAHDGNRVSSAERAKQAQQRQETALQGYEEEQRQAVYARPGGPAPTGGFAP